MYYYTGRALQRAFLPGALAACDIPAGTAWEALDTDTQERVAAASSVSNIKTTRCQIKSNH
jgi:hypothetical protein